MKERYRWEGWFLVLEFYGFVGWVLSCVVCWMVFVGGRKYSWGWVWGGIWRGGVGLVVGVNDLLRWCF